MLVGVVPTGITNMSRVVVMAPPKGSKGMAPAALITTGRTNTSGICGINKTRTVTTLTCKARSVPGMSGVIKPKGVCMTLTGGTICKFIDVSSVTKPDRVLILTSRATGPHFITTSLLSRTRRSRVTSTVLIAADVRLTRGMSTRASTFMGRLSENRVVRGSLSGCKRVLITRAVRSTVSTTGSVTSRRLRVIATGPFRIVAGVHGTKTVFVKRCSDRPLKSCFTKPGRILPAGKATGFFSPLSISSFVGGSDVVSCSEGTLRGVRASVRGFTRTRRLATRTGSVGMEFRGWRGEDYRYSTRRGQGLRGGSGESEC